MYKFIILLFVTFISINSWADENKSTTDTSSFCEDKYQECIDWEDKHCKDRIVTVGPDYWEWEYGWVNDVWTRYKVWHHSRMTLYRCSAKKTLPKYCAIDTDDDENYWRDDIVTVDYEYNQICHRF